MDNPATSFSEDAVPVAHSPAPKVHLCYLLHLCVFAHKHLALCVSVAALRHVSARVPVVVESRTPARHHLSASHLHRVT